ncbi:hypothetical protein VTO73DRAFT_7033 [Trametes versicolor]
MVLRYVEASRFGSGPCVGITAVAFSTHGKFLAAAALDGKLRIWSVETGQLLYVFSSTVPMLSLTWAGTDEDTVLCGLQDGTISCLFATPVDFHVMGFWAHSYPVEYMATKNSILASGAHAEVRIWRPQGAAWLLDTTLPAPSQTSFNRLLDIVVTSIHWVGEAGSQAQLLVIYLNHGVHIFNTTTWEQIRSVPIPGQIADASVSNDGRLIAISNVLTGFDVYAIETGAAVCSVGHTVSEYRKVPVLLVHNAVALLGGNLQGDVHLWDVDSGRKVHSLIHPRDDKILALAAHYDSVSDTFLIATGVLQSARSDYAVILWKAEELGHGHQEDSLNNRKTKGWLTFSSAIYVGIALPILAASIFIFGV